MTGVDDADLPDAFDLFFSRFDRLLSDDVPKLRESLTPLNDLEISQEQVITLFRRTQIGKSCRSRHSHMWTHVAQLC